MTTVTRFGAVLCGAALMALGAGCQMQSKAPRTLTGEAASGNLHLTLRTDRRVAHVGDTLTLTVEAKNTGWTGMTIEAATAAPVIATVWRYDSVKGWVRYKDFPPVSYRTRQKWDLGLGQRRDFTMKLAVGADWPVLETLKITAELNGRPDARPHVLLNIQPKS